MIKHLFREPAFAPARALLVRSETGRGVVQQLEQLATRTRVTGLEAARAAPPGAQPKLYGSYQPVPNLLSVDALSLRDEMTGALTVGHEGVHRLRRRQAMTGMLLGGFQGMPSAVVDATRAVRTGRNPFAAAARAIDERTLHEEVVAFEVEAKIAKELGAAGDDVAPGLRADGTLLNRDELLDMVRSKGGYRQQAWVGRAVPPLLIGLGGASVASHVRRDDE